MQKLFSGWLLATGAGMFGCTFERPTCGPADGCSCAVPRMYSTVARALADPVCAVVHLDPGIYLERLVVERSVTLMGAGAEASILDGEGEGTVIDIAAGLEVRLQSLAVRNGRARQGAGILNRGTLRLEEVLVQDNTAEGEGPAGGGIWNAGELTLRASKISGNHVRSSAAMLMAGAGIASEGGTIRLEQNSEVASNEIVSVGVASSSGRGAGISAMDAALVIADGSAVRGNVIDIDGHPMRATARGAGIYLEGKNGSASLVVSSAGSILGNSLVARGVDASAFGGGFYLETASLQLADGALQDNHVVAIAEHLADAAGGGGTLQDASFQITGTSISGNTVTATGREDPLVSKAATLATAGGLELINSSGELRASVIARNLAIASDEQDMAPSSVLLAQAGGISLRTSELGTTFAMQRCTLEGNRAVVDGEGSARAGGLQLSASTGASLTVVISASTLSGNVAKSFASAQAGGVLVRANVAPSSEAEARVSLDLVNSTISGNFAESLGGRGEGAGLSGEVAGGGAPRVDITLTSVTITQNTSAGTYTYAGGVSLSKLAPLGFVNLNSRGSIIAGNFAATYPDCSSSGATLTSGGYNLVGLLSGSSNGCVFGGNIGSDLVGATPGLAPLADNGGGTWTHAFLSGSAARDAGPSSADVATDQRGLPRPAGGRCDIGAFEQQ